MDTRKAYKALREVAKREGKPVAYVIAHIDRAIAEAIRTAEYNSDEVALKQWRMISANGDSPTALELVAYLAKKVEMEAGYMSDGAQ